MQTSSISREMSPDKPIFQQIRCYKITYVIHLILASFTTGRKTCKKVLAIPLYQTFLLSIQFKLSSGSSPRHPKIKHSGKHQWGGVSFATTLTAWGGLKTQTLPVEGSLSPTQNTFPTMRPAPKQSNDRALRMAIASEMTQ